MGWVLGSCTSGYRGLLGLECFLIFRGVVYCYSVWCGVKGGVYCLVVCGIDFVLGNCSVSFCVEVGYVIMILFTFF